MSPFSSLFSAPRLHPGPKASDHIRDPFGRDDALFNQEAPEHDLGGKLEAPRQSWRAGGSLEDILGATAFDLYGAVGRNQPNRPGDVFKVQTLLHREGHLDADKTDGPTGFWGSIDHDAVARFQKEQGLIVDGFLRPGGETIGRLKSFYPAQSKGMSGWTLPKPVGGVKPSIDRHEDYILPQIYPPLSDERDSDAGDEWQILPARDKLALGPVPLPVLLNAEAAPASDVPQHDGDTRPPGKQADAEILQGPPAERAGDFKQREGEWATYYDAVRKLPGITPNEEYSLMQTFAFEGGLQKDKASSAYGGILQEALDAAKASGRVEGIEKVKTPSDLTPEQHAAVSRFYLDRALGNVGGSAALDQLPDKYAAAAVADTLVRFGQNGGAEIIRDAMREEMRERGEAVPKTLEKTHGRLGEQGVATLKRLTAEESGRDSVLGKIQTVRDRKIIGTANEAGEIRRNRYFRFGD